MGALVLALTVPAQALTNGSFESGLTGWWTDFGGGGSGSITTQTHRNAIGVGDNREYDPTDGDHFAYLRAGDKNVWVSIGQVFAIDGPGKLEFDWFFDSDEGSARIALGKNDIATGVLLGEQELFFIQSSDLPSDGSTPWIHGEAILDPGVYTLAFGVMNVESRNEDSRLGIDNVYVGAIPEPMTMMALACGVGGLGGYLRRRRKM